MNYDNLKAYTLKEIDAEWSRLDDQFNELCRMQRHMNDLAVNMTAPADIANAYGIGDGYGDQAAAMMEMLYKLEEYLIENEASGWVAS